MNKVTKMRLLTGITLIAILFTALLAAIYTQPVQAANSLVKLTIDNRSNGELKLTMNGPNFYYLKVPAKSIKDFTVTRGTYNYVVQGCGISGKGSLSLNQNTTLINPICGGNIRTIPKDASRVNIGSAIKVVPIKIVSELDNRTTVVLSGPATYVFSLQPEQILKVTVGKETFKVRYFACGTYITREFQAYKNAKLVLRCQK